MWSNYLTEWSKFFKVATELITLLKGHGDLILLAISFWVTLLKDSDSLMLFRTFCAKGENICTLILIFFVANMYYFLIPLAGPCLSHWLWGLPAPPMAPSTGYTCLGSLTTCPSTYSSSPAPPSNKTLRVGPSVHFPRGRWRCQIWCQERHTPSLRSLSFRYY